MRQGKMLTPVHTRIVPVRRRPDMGRPLHDDITNNVPGLKISTESDTAATHAIQRIGRMIGENFENIGEYVSGLMEEFEYARLCSIQVIPKNISMKGRGLLEHRLTVERSKDLFCVDEGTDGLERLGMLKNILENALLDRKPMLIDYELGIKIDFENLDMNNSKCTVNPFSNGRKEGSLSVMPFYYRDSDDPSGIVVLDGDLTCLGSQLKDFEKAYWTAKAAVLVASQVSSQLTHRFDAITSLRKYTDFMVDLKQSVKGLMSQQIRDLYLILIDVDDFKMVNELYGYGKGNQVLRDVAEQIKVSVRSDDLVSRYGGEEFTVLVRNVSAEKAQEIAERIRENVSKVTVGMRPITCSIGVADVKDVADVVLRDQRQDEESVREAAFVFSNANLKMAKTTGKNKVIIRKVPSYSYLQRKLDERRRDQELNLSLA